MNDAYRVAPFADVHYFADTKWWEWHKNKDEFKAFAGERSTIFNTGAMIDDPEVHMLRNLGSEGMSTDASGLHTGSNSGHQAVNIAFLAGAKRIVLLGFDAKRASGKTHYFGDHPDNTQAPYDHMIYNFKKAAPFFTEQGVEVINATPGSAIQCFKKVSLLHALEAT